MEYNGTMLEILSGEIKKAKSVRSKERVIAIVVIVCSLLFLVYFIYSWISCYIKKPKVVEESRNDDIGTGYDMRSITDDH